MTIPKFEADLAAAFGDRLREEGPRPHGRGCHASPPLVLGERIWQALANQTWHHAETGEEYACSFRYAGGLIADICGFGDYLDWYCCTDYASPGRDAPSDPDYIAEDIVAGLAAFGWAPATKETR